MSAWLRPKLPDRPERFNLFGDFADRPQPAAWNRGYHYYATDTQSEYFSDGIEWHPVGASGGGDVDILATRVFGV